MTQMKSLETCSVVSIVSTTSGKAVTADILKKSDKSLRVALHGSNIALTLSRTDVRRPYVGYLHGMEFTTNG